jgi:hypothetical protein
MREACRGRSRLVLGLCTSQRNRLTRSIATEFERRKFVMKGSDIPQRTDVILAAGTLAVALLAVGVIFATAVAEEFVA